MLNSMATTHNKKLEERESPIVPTNILRSESAGRDELEMNANSRRISGSFRHSKLEEREIPISPNNIQSESNSRDALEKKANSMRIGNSFRHFKLEEIESPILPTDIRSESFSRDALEMKTNSRRIGNSFRTSQEYLQDLKEQQISMELEAHDSNRKNHGAFLSWEDLSVCALDGRQILCELKGFARPGEVLAIMGPSGCGKSTLLDALTGRLESNVKQTGKILINGRRQKLAFGTSAYVTQDDILMTTLTVREAVYYSAQLQLPDSMLWSEKKERADETIDGMGLGGAIDTRIGGWASKGISGGQKRRVSICMEILTRPKLLFLDEPTSGLDSAASYHVMGRISKLARREGMTVVAAIHQPCNEVFELFGGLCLLAYGKVVFFGPASQTSEFFALNGFPCPSLSNPSDHFLRTINKDFDIKDIEEGPGAKTETTSEVIEILVNSYNTSTYSQKMTQEIARIHEAITNDGALTRKAGQATFLAQSIILTRRSFVNMFRDPGYYRLRCVIYIGLGLCIGSMYYHIGHSYESIQARGAMLMFVAGFLTFMAIGGFPSFVEDMKIFRRERLNGHYGVGAFVIANTLSSTPYLALISVLPGAIAYYMVGLQAGIDHFAYFALVLYTCMILVEGLMMLVASLVPNYLMGIIVGAGIQSFMLLNAGFFRLPHDLPRPFFRYPMYYIGYPTYAIQGFYKNEFLGLTFPNIRAGGQATITGDEVLGEYWQIDTSYSKWIDFVIVCGMAVFYRIIFFAVIKISEKMKPMIRDLKPSIFPV